MRSAAIVPKPGRRGAGPVTGVFQPARTQNAPDQGGEGVLAKVATAEVMGLRVAELGMWLDARGAGLHLTAPPAHAKFLRPRAAGSEVLGRPLPYGP